MYGNAVPYGPEPRRVRFRRLGVVTEAKYENRFAFAKGAIPLSSTAVFSTSMTCGNGGELNPDVLELAVQRGQPLVIKVGATYCAPCQQLKRIFSDETIQLSLIHI